MSSFHLPTGIASEKKARKFRAVTMIIFLCEGEVREESTALRGSGFPFKRESPSTINFAFF